MKTKTHRPRALALMAAALLVPALAGCSRSQPDEAPADAIANDAGFNEALPVDETPVATNVVEPAPATNLSEEVPPPPPERSVDQQMMDDASATGMTARSTRGEEPETPPLADGNSGGQ